MPGKQNPSDVASRGLTGLEHDRFRFFLQGPEWLVKGEEAWPKQPSSKEVEEEVEKSNIKPVTVHAATVLKVAGGERRECLIDAATCKRETF